MIAEIYAGLSGFKSLYDSAKALKDMNDAAVRNAAVVELLEKILSAREAQAALLEQVGELKKEITAFETWDTEKERYQLQTTASGSAFYALKPDAQPPEPAHKICANCYQRRKKSFLQKIADNTARSSLGFPAMLECFECKSKIVA